VEKRIKIKFNIIAIIGIIIFCFAISPITLQNDTYYTIKIGEHILQNGIDMQDPFSFHDIPYTYPHWLYDVGIYLIYNISGMVGIYLSTVILSCILGLTVYITNKKLVKNDLISFVLTLGVMCILRAFVAARAQLVTFILFALAVFFIEKFLETKKKRYAIFLIIIPIIIANVHLAVWPFYFILFLPFIAEYLLTIILDLHLEYRVGIKFRKILINILSKKDKNKEEIEKLKKINEQKNQKLKEVIKNNSQRRENPYKVKLEKNNAVIYLILIMVICIFTGLCTPLGDTPYTYLVKTMQGNTTQNISEHLPMVLINSKYTLAIIAIVLTILIFTDIKIKLRDLFMIGGLLVLALMSARQLSILTLIGVYVINRLLCDLFDKYDPEGTQQFTKLIINPFGTAITILIVILFSVIVYRQQAGNKFIDISSYPVEAAKYLKENVDVNNIHLYNEYNYGSYLLYEDIPVFIDSRADLYTPEFNGDKNKDIFNDFLKVSGINIYYEEIFKKYEITHLLIPNNAKVNIFLKRDQNYKSLYKDDNFIIYERLTNNQ
jgi:hypothetical protein